MKKKKIKDKVYFNCTRGFDVSRTESNNILFCISHSLTISSRNLGTFSTLYNLPSLFNRFERMDPIEKFSPAELVEKLASEFLSK